MTPILDLFEAHLTVGDLDRAIAFYGGVLGLEQALLVPARRAAFYWLGGRGKAMLGLWEAGSAPMRMNLHVAFRVGLDELLLAVGQLKAAGIEPLDFDSQPTTEPVVLGWMPAASLYFKDPDGNLLEYLCMLDEVPRPEAGVMPWSEWNQSKPT